MTVRLRDSLPVRFKNAVSLARRALHCERLESRCLLHGLPLAVAYEPVASLDNADAPAVAPHIGQPIVIEALRLAEHPAGDAAAAPTGSSDVDSVSTEGLHNTGMPGDDLPSDSAANQSPDDALDPVDALNSPETVSADDLEETPAEDTSAEDTSAEDAKDVGGADEVSGADGASDGVGDGAGDAEDAGDKQPEEAGMGGLQAEGEAAPLTPQSSLLAASSYGGMNDPVVLASVSAPSGDGGAASSASRIAASTESWTGLATMSDSLPRGTSSEVALTEALSSSGEDALQSATGGSAADRSAGNSGSRMSLNSDMQTQTQLSQSLHVHDLQSQGLHPSSSEISSDHSVPWLSSNIKLASAFISAESAFTGDHDFSPSTGSLAIEQANDYGAQSFSSDSTETPGAADGQDAPYVDNGGVAQRILRATLQQRSRQRRAERAAASDSMHEEVARHARRHIQHAYLRVREGSDGLVELSIEPGSDTNAQSEFHAAESSSSERGWVVASMGLYREFNLGLSANKTLPETSMPEANANGPEGAEAIDAAHADDSTLEGSSDDAAFYSLGQQALPLGLLALTGLLAISRQRFAGKRRNAVEEGNHEQ